MTTTDIEGIVDDYLRRLDSALSQLPSSRRQQLVAEIAEHVEQARAGLPNETEAAVRELLDRVGQPEDIAAEALIDQPDQIGPRSRRRVAVGLIALIVIVVIGVGLGVFFNSRGNGKTSTTPATVTTAPPIVVPNVVGLAAAQATQELSSVGLEAKVAPSVHSTVRAGRVIAQAPVTGSRMLPGSVVTLTISSGP